MADDTNPSSPAYPATSQNQFGFKANLFRKVNFQKAMNKQDLKNKVEKPRTDGSLASEATPRGGKQEFDVVKNFKWTLSNVGYDTREIPYIRLLEHKVNQTSITKQFKFYTNLAGDALTSAAGSSQSQRTDSTLNVYKELWPQNPTGFSYKFPYFNKINMELSTEPWAALDSIGDVAKSGVAAIPGIGKDLAKGVDLIKAGTNLALNLQYPAVGVADRPKIFMAHSDRTITISVTLYNTMDVKDWVKNRELLYILMSQNHFNKRDYTTGIPPVFYEVFIPGSYYSAACCVTNIRIENLGNQRLMMNSIVPDAYQLEITLTELTKPSKNQFEAMETGEARGRVRASERTTEE